MSVFTEITTWLSLDTFRAKKRFGLPTVEDDDAEIGDVMFDTTLGVIKVLTDDGWSIIGTEGSIIGGGAEYAARQLEIPAAGEDASVRLAQLVAENVHDAFLIDDRDIDLMPSGTTIDLGGKTLWVENGKTINIAAGKTLKNFYLKAQDDARVFTGAGTVEDILNPFVSLCWFRATADDNYDTNAFPTDNYPFWLQALNSFPENKIARIYLPASKTVYVDDNLGNFYYFGTNIGAVNRAFQLFGDGRQSAIRMNGAQLGIKLVKDESYIDQIRIIGKAGQLSGGYNSPSAHGVWLAGNSCTATNVIVQNFDGDGFYIAGDVNEGTNANLFKVSRCKAIRVGRAGFKTEGGDSNSGILASCFADACGRFGFWLKDFLGNDVSVPSTQATASGHNLQKSLVTYGGFTWNAIADNIGTTPGTDPNKWVKVNFTSTFASAWSGSTQYYSSAAYFLDGETQLGVLVAAYTEANVLFEGDEYPIIQGSNTIVINGMLALQGSYPGALALVNSVLTSLNFQARNRANQSYAKLDGKGFAGVLAALILGNYQTGANFSLSQLETDEFGFSTDNLGSSANVRFRLHTVDGITRITSRHDGGLDIGDDTYAKVYSNVGVATAKPSDSFGANGWVRWNTGTDTTVAGWRKVSGAWQTLYHGAQLLANYYADAPTSGTGETDYYSYTLAANKLTTNGQSIEATYHIDNDAAIQDLKLYFGGQVVQTWNVPTSNYIYKVEARFIRSGSTTLRAEVSISSEEGTINNIEDLSSVNYTATNIIKITGTASSGTPVAKSGKIEMK